MPHRPTTEPAHDPGSGGPVYSGEPVGGRSQRADARRNRARVLAAAREAFALEGVGVPLDEIARRAGVGPGTVYRNFPSKEALFEAAVDELMQGLHDRAVELLAGADPEAFFAYLAEVVEAGSANRALIDALSGTNSDMSTACSELSEQLTARMEDLLQVAQEAQLVRGDVRAVNLKPLIVGILAAHAAAGDDTSAQWLTQVACDGLRVKHS